MSKIKKGLIEEYSLFIKKGMRNRFKYNKKCLKCRNGCKQSYQVKIVKCPYFEDIYGKKRLCK